MMEALAGRAPGSRTWTVTGLRPLSIEEELKVRPGTHAVAVTFAPADPAGGGKVLAFDGTVGFERGGVVLITHDGERLIARSARH